MRKILLPILFILFAAQSQAFAQDDDAELGSTQDTAPALRDENSIMDESDLEPINPAPPQERAEPRPTAVPSASVAPKQPAPLAKERPESVAPKSSSEGFRLLDGRRKPGSTFGFGVSRPTSIGKYNHYDYLYGKPRSFPTFYGGYYLGSYLFDFGIVGRSAYYSAQGHPLATRDSIQTPQKGDLEGQLKDDNQKIALTLIPLQTTAELAISPFKVRWIVLRGWMGWEYLYVQETIEPSLASTTTNTSSGTYTSAGWNSGVVTGVMASFSMTGLDPRADYSMRALGIDRMYLSLSFDIVKTVQAKMGNFDRKTYGIAFSFEGLR